MAKRKDPMRRSKRQLALLAHALVAAILTAACSHSGNLAIGSNTLMDGRRAFTPPAAIADWQSLGSTTATELQFKYPTSFTSAPDFSASKAQGMDRIENSGYAFTGGSLIHPA